MTSFSSNSILSLLRASIAWTGCLLLGLNASAQVPGICNVPANADPYRNQFDGPGVISDQQREQLLRLISANNNNSFATRSFDSTSTPADDLLGNKQSNDLLDPFGKAGGDDPLSQMGPDAKRDQERKSQREATPKVDPKAAVDPHAEVFADTMYPTAAQCAKCHQRIYDEWRVSSHAYAAVSPMFHRFEQAVATLTRGTAGTFCMRCHSPISTQLNYPREASIFEGPSVFREGITCVVCHRVVERYGRVNGERRIETGSIYDPVVGNLGGDGVPRVIADKDNFKVKIDPNDKRPLQAIHRGAIQFEQLADSSYCAGCHQVVVQPGIGLEIVYQQYRAGPACKKGVSCQDCHMGLIPGKASGYATAPGAEIGGKATSPMRKHANHMFYGPMYPIANPGIFPHNEKSLRWKVEQWMQFDWRSGWGTDEFEREISRRFGPQTKGANLGFPEPWKLAEDRRDARKIINDNLRLIDVKRANARAILENGSRIDGPFFNGELFKSTNTSTPFTLAGHRGLHQLPILGQQRGGQLPGVNSIPVAGQDLPIEFVVTNTSEGHNMPSGSLGAQPQLWLNVVLIGPSGERIWESGHLDPNGDVLDNHSLFVRNRSIPADQQLVNFQTKFLITNLKGTDREMYLPVNVDIDPLPFFRPGTVPFTVLNHAPFARMESRSIPPTDFRRARYTIPGNLICQPGRYRLSVRLRSRVEPIYFVKFVEGTPEMERLLNEGIIDVHPYSTEFDIR